MHTFFLFFSALDPDQKWQRGRESGGGTVSENGIGMKTRCAVECKKRESSDAVVFPLLLSISLSLGTLLVVLCGVQGFLCLLIVVKRTATPSQWSSLWSLLVSCCHLMVKCSAPGPFAGRVPSTRTVSCCLILFRCNLCLEREETVNHVRYRKRAEKKKEKEGKQKKKHTHTHREKKWSNHA